MSDQDRASPDNMNKKSGRKVMRIFKKMSIIRLLVDPISNFPNMIRIDKNCMVQSKENYQPDLALSERKITVHS